MKLCYQLSIAMTKSALFLLLLLQLKRIKDPPRLQVLALFGMTSRTLDCPITRCAINAEIRVFDSQLDKIILL